MPYEPPIPFYQYKLIHLVIPYFFVLYECYTSTSGIGLDTPAFIVKQIELPPSRSNTNPLLASSLIRPPHSSSLHTPSRCLYTQPNFPK